MEMILSLEPIAIYEWLIAFKQFNYLVWEVFNTIEFILLNVFLPIKSNYALLLSENIGFRLILSGSSMYGKLINSEKVYFKFSNSFGTDYTTLDNNAFFYKLDLESLLS